MGCDIHIWVEKEGQQGQWYMMDEVHMGRFYHCFGLLADGVRGCEGPFEPRGFPSDISSGALVATTFMVVSDALEEAFSHECSYPDNDWRVIRQEQTVGKTTADEWVHAGFAEQTLTGSEERVTHPDFHTHSWLTLGEVLSLAKMEDGSAHDWLMQLAGKIQEERGDRIVFCFDN